ncbi:DUF2635 domain-containing protein [Mixta calida]|uniref:DUF2635 domain-containing protein n=1 Tax=Mixta calida TaxID=665913 RepID=UPI0037433BE5
MKIKPVGGRAVRDPVKRTLIPAEGIDITPDAFWLRRLRDGDVVEVSPENTAPPATKAPSALSLAAPGGDSVSQAANSSSEANS